MIAYYLCCCSDSDIPDLKLVVALTMAGPVRQPIDIASLEKYIDATVPDIKAPISLKQFGFGQSNPTYQITDSKQGKYVIRKKPPGKLVSKVCPILKAVNILLY